jgi:peptidoglycan hydrolase CwlO-like protein
MKGRTAEKVNRLIDKVVAIGSILKVTRDTLQERSENMSEEKRVSDKGEKLKREIEALSVLITNLEAADAARPEE